MNNKPVKELLLKLNNGESYTFMGNVAEQICRECLDMDFNWHKESFTWTNDDLDKAIIIYTKNIASMSIFK